MKYFVIVAVLYREPVRFAFWHVEDGWVADSMANATVFSESETKTFRLPLCGAWLELPAFKAEPSFKESFSEGG